MDYLIILFAVLAIGLAIVGIIGTIIPALPGPPLSYGALILAAFTSHGHVSTTVLIVFGLLTAAVTIIDYIAPAWMTKLGGGSKKAITGSTIGMIVGLFFMPWGLIIGPFIGAFIGEIIANSTTSQALKIAFYTFLSFLLTTGLKLIICFLMLYYVAMAYIDYWLA